VRQSPLGRTALSRDHHVWVDLLTDDGRQLEGGYGSGITPEDVLERARQRYRVEQESRPLPGPRVLP
jgi:hypothetical protein